MFACAMVAFLATNGFWPSVPLPVRFVAAALFGVLQVCSHVFLPIFPHLVWARCVLAEFDRVQQYLNLSGTEFGMVRFVVRHVPKRPRSRPDRLCCWPRHHDAFYVQLDGRLVSFKLCALAKHEHEPHN